jgi:hypothetical protein
VGGKKGYILAVCRVELVLADSIEFKHVINEEVMGIMVTHPVVSINAKWMVWDAETQLIINGTNQVRWLPSIWCV